ncbi:MAG: glycosyltransferase family 4 protein [Isosphaeraceae bacterium]|nr:glycosyltransferase family 4 protein [Isosphaeraceae bacterium]
MNLGFFTPSYPTISGEGGIGTYTRHLALALAALGHEVHVLTPGSAARIVRDGPVMVHLTRSDYIPILERMIPGSGACCRIGIAMRRLVKQHKLDIVEFPNWEGLGLGFTWGRPVPIVVRLHTSSLESLIIDGLVPHRAAQWEVSRERWLALRADALVTHSRAHRSAMANELAVDDRRISVIPHGIPIHPGFQKPPCQSGEFTVAYLGRLERRKGTIHLLQAIPAVLRSVPEAHFVLIGADRPHCPGGRTHAQYINEELPAEVQARIRLIGRLPDEEVDRWLQRADLFVAPSLYESFGLVFLEAMRWGTPVIGTRVGGIPEIIDDGETGLLVPAESPGELAEAIIALLRDERRRRQMGEAGRRKVEMTFGIEGIARRVAEHYTQIIEERR